MGDARVQYQLERTLPGLQLAAKYELFDDTQRRKLTSKRRDFERGLVQRHVTPEAYLRYIQYEQDLEKLRQIRLKEALQDEDIPRQDVAKMRSEATQHIVSIYERGVQRCKYDVDLWLQYMAWAQQQKMRTAVSRISARALALFPNKLELWLAEADYELNANMSTTTARALLQQALRLNAIQHQARIAAQQKESARIRPRKRARKSDGAAHDVAPPQELRVRPSGNAKDDGPTSIISDKEKDLVRLVLEYIRMELVFIERLRRRRAVLKILDDNEAGDAKSLAANIDGKGKEVSERDESVVPATGDDEAAAPSIAKLAEEGIVAETTPSGSILQGSIPSAALLSFVSLDSASSLPPRTHYALLLAVGQLVRAFPFLEKADSLRSHLSSEVNTALEQRFPDDPSVLLYVSASKALDEASAAHIQKRIETNPEDEMERGSLLRSASKLDRSVSSELHLVCEGIGQQEHPLHPMSAVLSIIEMNFAPRIEEAVAMAHAIRETLTSLRKRVQALVAAGKASAEHFTVQLFLASVFIRLSTKLGYDFHMYLVAFAELIANDAAKAGVNKKDLSTAQRAVTSTKREAHLEMQGERSKEDGEEGSQDEEESAEG